MNSTSSVSCAVVGNEDVQHKYLNSTLCYMYFCTNCLTGYIRWVYLPCLCVMCMCTCISITRINMNTANTPSLYGFTTGHIYAVLCYPDMHIIIFTSPFLISCVVLNCGLLRTWTIQVKSSSCLPVVSRVAQNWCPTRNVSPQLWIIN